MVAKYVVCFLILLLFSVMVSVIVMLIIYFSYKFFLQETIIFYVYQTF